MTEMPTTPLQRRMIEDLSVRNFIPGARRDFVRSG